MKYYIQTWALGESDCISVFYNLFVSPPPQRATKLFRPHINFVFASPARLLFFSLITFNLPSSLIPFLFSFVFFFASGSFSIVGLL